MRRFSSILSGAAVLVLLGGPQQAPAQPATAPARPTAVPARPAAAPARPPAAPPAAPAPRGGAACHNGMSFDRFLADLKQQAVAAGVSQRALAEAAPYLVYDQSIVNRDRGQRVFGQVFNEFARNRASDGAAKNAQARIRMHAAAFNRAEKEYGVPPAVIAAFWGLESSFGAELGKLHSLPSLVSLAYDCRRSEMFQKETIAALKIIDRGDLTASEMIGSWAGELGQTQFLPTHYFNYAVDYDGDGHRNLLSSVPDVIGSTANYIANGSEMAARRTLATGSPGAAKPPLGSGRSDDPASALEMDAARCHLSRRQGIAERQPAGIAAVADGADGTGIPRLCEFRRLYRMEQLADLFDHRRLSRHPHRRCAADAASRGAGRATAVQRAARVAAVAGARGI